MAFKHNGPGCCNCNGGPPTYPPCSCNLPCGWTQSDWSTPLTLTWRYGYNCTDAYGASSGQVMTMTSTLSPSTLTKVQSYTNGVPNYCEYPYWLSPLIPIPVSDSCADTQYIQFYASCAGETDIVGGGWNIYSDPAGTTLVSQGQYAGQGDYFLACNPFSFTWGISESEGLGLSGVITQ